MSPWIGLGLLAFGLTGVVPGRVLAAEPGPLASGSALEDLLDAAEVQRGAFGAEVLADLLVREALLFEFLSGGLADLGDFLVQRLDVFEGFGGHPPPLGGVFDRSQIVDQFAQHGGRPPHGGQCRGHLATERFSLRGYLLRCVRGYLYIEEDRKNLTEETRMASDKKIFTSDVPK